MLPRLFVLWGLLAAGGLHAETGASAWLRYSRLDNTAIGQYRLAIPATITNVSRSELTRSAQHELIRGIRGMLELTLRVEPRPPAENVIVLGTQDAIRRAGLPLPPAAAIPEDGYWLKTLDSGGMRRLIVTADNDRGVLYGAFALLRKIGLGEPIDGLDERQSPFAPVRWVNQWDNLDGSIERGYGGRSIFWENRRARQDLSRVNDYGRMLASLGINGCAINNVNSDRRVLAADFIPEAARIAGALRPWGVRVALAVDFGSPMNLGGLDTFDPLDPRVIDWWKSKADELYRAIPDLAGIVIKADSEGRVGPSAYGRTHADAANVVARALKPHGGLIFYRGFVYDHKMDWRNLKNDRARAAFDNFKFLDGLFDDNVVIQIKNGPIDFQVREPASALFGALEKTNQAVELQITQEYMGQARHLVYLAPMWKEVLDFDMHARDTTTPVKALVAGRVFHRPAGGFVGVANVGLDDNWLGNHLLHTGKTVIQHIYDCHYEGAAAVEEYVREWKSLAGRVDDRRYEDVRAQLEYQAGQAEVWRDAVAGWFFRASGIVDLQGRVGRHPGRFEAEAMSLVGYVAADVTPWEAASGGKAVECRAARCEAVHPFDGPAGWYTIRVRYYDQNNGVSRFRLRIGEQLIDEWNAEDRVPTQKIDGSSSARRTVAGIALRPGDKICVEGLPNGGETAAIDYIEILPEGK